MRELDGPFDVIFIDADRNNYGFYYEHALRALNAKIHQDERTDLSMVPIADGLTLVQKR